MTEHGDEITDEAADKYMKCFYEWEAFEDRIKSSLQFARAIVQNPVKLTPADVVYWKRQSKQTRDFFNERFSELMVKTLKTIEIGEDK